jgi:hypothetical protein
MKGSYNISIKYGEVQYNLTVKDKFTLICGDSGTGKTTLCDILDRNFISQKTGNGSSTGIEIMINNIPWNESEIKVYNLSYNLEYYEALPKYQNNIVFIDEFHDVLQLSSIKTKLCRYDCYYVIITRKCLNSLPIDVNSVYELVTTKHGEQFISKFQPWIKFKYEDSIYPDVLITEDSRSSYNYFSKIVEQDKIATLNGRGNLMRIIDSILNKNSNTAIIQLNDKFAMLIDGCGYGSELYRLYNFLLIKNKVQINDKKVYIILIESFEVMLLRSGLFEILGADPRAIEEDLNNIDYSIVNNKEKFYEKILDKYYQLYLNDKYKKSENIPNCFYQPEVVVKILEQIYPILLSNILIDKSGCTEDLIDKRCKVNLLSNEDQTKNFI